MLTPAKVSSSRGPLFRTSDLVDMVVGEITIRSNSVIDRKAKIMSKEIEAASKVMREARTMFAREMDSLTEAELRLTASAKQTSTNVRKAANEIHEGVQRIEKAANFDRLERQVALLERAAAAMSVLAELESSGKLAKVIAAVK